MSGIACTANPKIAMTAQAAFLVLCRLLAWRAIVYGQLEFITAAMLGRHVPKLPSKVIQLGGGSRELFYYPKDTQQVTIVGEAINAGMHCVHCQIVQRRPAACNYMG